MFQQLLKYFTKQFIKDVGRKPQTAAEFMSIQNEVVRHINLTKGKGITGSVRTSTGDVKPISDPFQGFTPKVIQGGKPKEGIGTLFKDSPEAIAKIKADNKAAVERLRNKKKTVEDFSDDGDFDPGGMASGGLARAGYAGGKKVDLDRRMILKGLGALAALPVVGKFFKLAKPLVKTRDIRIKFKQDADFSYEGPESGWEGGSWLNLDFVPLTKKGTKILDDLAKNKKIDKSIDGKETYYGVANSENGLMAVEDIKKMKGDMEIETTVSDKVKNSLKGEYETTKIYSGKDIDSKTILKESADDLVTDPIYANPEFTDEFTEEIINTINPVVKKASGGIAGQLHLNEGGRVPMIFGGSAGLKGLIASIKASLNKGRTEKIKTLFPTYSVAEKELLKLGEKYLPKDAATLAAKEIQGKGEGIEILIERLKHDKKLLERQAKNKAMNDPNLDFMMESLEKTMPQAYGPHLKKYTNIDKDILQLETIKKNLIMKDRKLHASGGRAGTGLNYLLGEDDQNVRTPYQGGLPGLLGE